MTLASASGKAILFGEHAVVYGQPAIAVPLSQIRTTVQIENLDPGSTGLLIDAPDISQSYWLHDADRDDPLASAVRLALDELGVKAPVDNHPLAAPHCIGARIKRGRLGCRHPRFERPSRETTRS